MAQAARCSSWRVIVLLPADRRVPGRIRPDRAGHPRQVGQGPGDLDDLVRGAGVDLPEIDGSADGGDGFGGGRPGAAQLSGRDVAVGLPGGVPQPRRARTDVPGYCCRRLQGPRMPPPRRPGR